MRNQLIKSNQIKSINQFQRRATLSEGERARAVSTKLSMKPPPLRPKPHAYRRTHHPRHTERASRAITPRTPAPRRAISPPISLRREISPTTHAPRIHPARASAPTSVAATAPHARSRAQRIAPKISARDTARHRARAAPPHHRATTARRAHRRARYDDHRAMARESHRHRRPSPRWRARASSAPTTPPRHILFFPPAHRVRTSSRTRARRRRRRRRLRRMRTRPTSKATDRRLDRHRRARAVRCGVWCVPVRRRRSTFGVQKLIERDRSRVVVSRTTRTTRTRTTTTVLRNPPRDRDRDRDRDRPTDRSITIFYTNSCYLSDDAPPRGGDP